MLIFCDKLTANGLINLLNSPTETTIEANGDGNFGNHNQVSNNHNNLQHNNHDEPAVISTTNGWNNTNGHTTTNFFKKSLGKPFSSLKTFSAKMAVQLITNESVTALVKNAASSLRSLVLTGCTNLTDPGVVAIGANCPNLIILTLSQCSQIVSFQ